MDYEIQNIKQIQSNKLFPLGTESFLGTNGFSISQEIPCAEWNLEVD